MRAILGRTTTAPVAHMASILNPKPTQMLNPIRPDSKLRHLIAHLRFYRAPPPSAPQLDANGEDVDDRGKVFSPMGLAQSAVPPIRPAEDFMFKRAAVLVCLFKGDSGDLRVVLTKRSSKLSTHSGEVSLPGGKAEEGDADDKETAVREAKEEIGLDPGSVTVLTVLEPFLSKHLLRVVPVIGILTSNEAFKPVSNPAEVEAVFDAPLEMFLKDENRRSEEREWLGAEYLVHYFDLETGSQKFVIWGLTASILIRAASVVYQRPPEFLEQESRFRIPNHRKTTHSRQ